MLKGALIGFGQVAEKAHVPAWVRMSDMSIAAVVENQPERAAAARRALPGVAVYEDAEAMLLREKPDFIDIATPPFLHASQAWLGLQHGCHVLCEKPLTLERAQFERLRAEAARRKRALFTVHNWKYAPLFQKLRELLLSGVVGRPRHVELHTLRNQPAATAASSRPASASPRRSETGREENDLRPASSRPASASSAGDNWRTDVRAAGGGILVDHGWHNVYLLTWLLDASPVEAYGKLRYPKGSEAEEEAVCLLGFPQATSLVYLTWRAARRSHWGIVYGDEGLIEILDDKLLLRRAADPPQTFLFDEPLSRGSAHPEWFHALLPEFREAVAGGPARERNLAETDACVSVLQAMYGARTTTKTTVMAGS